MSKEAEDIVSDDRNEKDEEEKDEEDSYYNIDDLGLDIPDVNGPAVPPDECPSKNTHRVAFNQLAFGYDENGKLKKPLFKSKRWTDEKYIVHVGILSEWNNADLDSRKTFRQKNPRGYNMSARYSLDILQMPNGSRQFSLKIRTSSSKKHTGTVIIPQSRVFDAIFSAHERVAHQKVAATHACCRKIFRNISQEQCSMFIKTCPTCATDSPNIKKLHGTVTPIRSARFRDRMQVDLIDMRSCRRKNPFGVMMQYIVVCKDHFTGFMVANCIPRKRPSYVAFDSLELSSA
jgi:hypothetical protein